MSRVNLKFWKKPNQNYQLNSLEVEVLPQRDLPKKLPNSNFKQTEKIPKKVSDCVPWPRKRKKRPINQCPLRIKNLLTFFSSTLVLFLKICCLLDEKILRQIKFFKMFTSRQNTFIKIIGELFFWVLIAA